MENIDYKSDPTAGWISELRQRFRVEKSIDECLTRKLRSRRLDYCPPDIDELREHLHSFLSEQLPGTHIAINNFQRLPGGASKQNFHFELVLKDGAEHGRRDLLLRLDPGEAIVEMHRLREFQLLRAAQRTVPVPKAYHVDAEGTWLGRPFLITEFVRGIAQPELGGKPSGVGVDFGNSLRQVLATQWKEYGRKMRWKTIP